MSQDSWKHIYVK